MSNLLNDCFHSGKEAAMILSLPPFYICLFYYAQHSAAAECTVVFRKRDGFISFVVGDQAVVSLFLNINIAVNYKDADLSNFHAVTFLNKHLVTVLESR